MLKLFITVTLLTFAVNGKILDVSVWRHKGPWELENRPDPFSGWALVSVMFSFA